MPNPCEADGMIGLVTREGDLPRVEEASLPGLLPGPVLAGGYRVSYLPGGALEDALSRFGGGIMPALPLLMTPQSLFPGDALPPAWNFGGVLPGFPVRPGNTAELVEAGIWQAQRQPYLELTGRGVLLGFVDTGIDYTLPAFRYENGRTRIRALWDQTVPGAPPAGYSRGTAYTAAQLDAALAQEDPFAAVPSQDAGGHGTFLAGVAAGRDPFMPGAAPDAELLAVKLRPAPPALRAWHLTPSGAPAYTSADLLEGVNWLADRARELGRPLAICIGMGSADGAHDGSSLPEQYLSRLGVGTGRVIVSAAGNEAARGHHAAGRLAADGGEDRIRVYTGGGDVSLQIWNGEADLFSVGVVSPAGEEVARVPPSPGVRVRLPLRAGSGTVEVSYWYPYPLSGAQLTWVKLITPAAGVWTVRLYGSRVLDGSWQAWLPAGSLSAPDVRLLAEPPREAADVRLPTPAGAEAADGGTLTVPGTAPGLISVGAYTSATGQRWEHSACGPNRAGAQRPDLCAPGVEVGGNLPGGYPEGADGRPAAPGTAAYGVMSGTSVAAALTAGGAALLLGWGIVEGRDTQMNTARVRTHLIRGCARDVGVSYPDACWGYGKLDLMGALAAMGR